MTEALTWRPRRVRLLPQEADTGRRVSKMRFERGDSTRLSWIDPNLAYRYDNDSAIPVRMREGRPLWRDAGPVALLKRGAYRTPQGNSEFRRPDVVEDAFQIVESALRIRIYGMRTDLKMKVFEWSDGELVVPADVGRQARVGAQVQRWLDCAEAAAQAVRRAIRSLYPRAAAGNSAALGRTIDRAERAYWSALETPFYRLLARAATLTEADVDQAERLAPVADEWKSAIRRNATAAFEDAADSYDADADALQRAVEARQRLGAALKRILE